MQMPFFNSLTEDEQAEIAHYIILTRYERDQFVFHLGDPACDIFFLHSGMVKVTYGNPRGDEAIVSIFQPGDIFGDLFLGKYRSRVGTAIAISDVVVGKMSEGDFLYLCRTLPAFSISFIQHQADRQRETLARAHALMHVDAKSRLLGTLLNLSRHYCCTEAGWFKVPDCITQSDIASMSCLNRTTVSLLINDLRRQGVLGGTGRNLTIHRPAVRALMESNGLEILE